MPGPRGERIVKPYLAAKWSDYAKCKGLSTDWFFHNDRNGGPYVTQAKRICHDCPAKDDCLTYALTMGEMYGIWGGMTVGQRRNLGTKLTSMADRLSKAQKLRERELSKIIDANFDKIVNKLINENKADKKCS